MFAIPNYFTQIYRVNNHLDHDSLREGMHVKYSMEAWIKWRERHLGVQLELLREFVLFWRQFGQSGDGVSDDGNVDGSSGGSNRIYVSYEELLRQEEEEAPKDVIRMALFLEESVQSMLLLSTGNNEIVQKDDNNDIHNNNIDNIQQQSIIVAQATNELMERMIPSNEVPCLWKSVIHQRHHDHDEDDDMVWSQQHRPYTAQNLMDISSTLLDLIHQINSDDNNDDDDDDDRILVDILSRYQQEVQRFYQEIAYRDITASSKLIDVVDEERQKKIGKLSPVDLVLHHHHHQEGGGDLDQQQPPLQQHQQVVDQSTATIKEEEKKTFHIFQVSQPDTGGIFLTNWLMGIFEPHTDIAYIMEEEQEEEEDGATPPPPPRVIQNGHEINISKTIVTKTENLDLMQLYKLYRPLFDEVLFVVSTRGGGTNDDDSTPLSSSDDMCEYKNVLCIQSEELIYYNIQELTGVVRSLTNKLRNRFRYFFGTGSEWLSFEREGDALDRLDAMSKAAVELAGKPLDVMDNRFGIFGRSGGGGGGTTDPRRRLSVALPDGGCKITWPQPPQPPFETAYAASYPGCGARMTWNLVEALTGLWTGDDWDSNNRGKRVVTVKTHYPHDAGRLVPWDDEIHRALVIIRNPMQAIPSFFNHIYEMKNHLPVHSQRAPVDAWIEWRDRLAAIQISRFEKFVDYWMERFSQLNDNRIFVSYERLTDDDLGPEEAIRITNFLGQSEGVTPIDTEAVPCVWKAVVKYKESLKSSFKHNDQSSGGSRNRRRRLDPMHHNSQRSGPTERPYTPELLSAMSDMLLRLIQKWGDRHLRLRKVLEGYQEDVAAAHLTATAGNNADAPIAPGVVSNEKPLQKNFHVILACPLEMDCTVLNNVLAGLFDPPDAYVSVMEDDSSEILVRRQGSIVPIESSVVTMSHEMNLLALYKLTKPKFDEVYFVAPVTGESCEYENVMCVDNDALGYFNPDGMEDVVTKLAKRLRNHFFEDPNIVGENKLVDALNRLVDMESLRTDGNNNSLLEEKFGIRGNASMKMKDMGSMMLTSDNAPLSINGKTYHIFQASPPHTASTVLNNFLIGMFEPNAEYSFMIYNQERRIRRHDKDVAIDDGHIVTKTHITDLMSLYKQYRNTFDEILFVVANRGVSPETRIDASLCQYNNVLCVEYEELLYSDERERELVVRALATKLKDRFDYFFGSYFDLMDNNRLQNAVTRLEQMDQATLSLSDQPFTMSDNKFGVHGGHRNRDGTEMLGSSSAGSSANRKLFYCGGAEGLHRKEFKYSTFGLFLANTLFPEYEGKIEYQPGRPLVNTAIPLTDDTLEQASPSDILIMHSHQKCEILSLEDFPGKQLHVNAEHYDMHPLHLLNPNGELTMNYLPPGEQSYVIGPHEDSRHSIRIPYCSMKLWYLHKTRPDEAILSKIIDPSQKPVGTKEHFLLYINSHYIEYRERAARALSEIGTIHTAGKCQGNFEVQPPLKPDGSPEQCEPFEDSRRPSSILPVSASNDRDTQGQNSSLFSKYRFALVMENADAPGYVSEKILDAFIAGSIPVYFGSRFVFEIFNPKAFVFFDLAIPQQALNQIQFLEQNPSEYERMLKEPIIANEEVLEKYFSWDETIGNGSLKQRIRQMMGLQGSGASPQW